MIDFDDKVKAVLGAYHARIKEESALMQSLPTEEGMKRRDEFLLPVGEEVGLFLNSVIKASDAQVILEIGTSYGYATLWLAEAASKTGGQVISLEVDGKKVAYAQKKIEEAGLLSVVELR